MIPNVIHFIFGLQEDFGLKSFSFVHYLAIKSAYDCNQPEAIKFYYAYEPSGEWWGKSKKYLTLVKVDPAAEIFGNKLSHYAHKTDVLRLEILLKEGGIYLDMDVVCLNSFKPLLKHDCVMGREYDYGLCNAVILARPGARFLRKWLEEFRDFNPNRYNQHAVIRPLKLARENPRDIHIEDQYAFFWPLYDNPDPLWKEHDRPVPRVILSQSYCVHLWSKFWWETYLKNLTPESLYNTHTPFATIFRRFLEPARNGGALEQRNKLRRPVLFFISSLFSVKEALLRARKALRFRRRSLGEVMGLLNSPATPNRFDLGGTGPGRYGWKTVNLVPGADIREDILDTDRYCQDGAVDAFYMGHTFEHIPSVQVKEFAKALLKKLKKGGALVVVQTDIKKALKLYHRNRIDFFALRDIIFSPIDRREKSAATTGRDLQLHQYMWGAEELKKELLHYGFSSAEIIRAGHWNFDQTSVFPFQRNEQYFGTKIPNLGVVAYKG